MGGGGCDDEGFVDWGCTGEGSQPEIKLPGLLCVSWVDTGELSKSKACLAVPRSGCVYGEEKFETHIFLAWLGSLVWVLAVPQDLSQCLNI